MIELDSVRFLEAVREVRRLATIVEQDLGDLEAVSSHDIRQRVAGTISEMRDQISFIGAQSAWVAANRFHQLLLNRNVELKYVDFRNSFRDIESRFSDHLQFIRLFVVQGEQVALLGSASELLGEPCASHFRDAWFDCEEAAKCIVVQRPTAAVFHSMRILEIGIRAFAKRLNIENPLKPSLRNWGVVLSTIREKLDSQYPSSKRLPGSEGALYEKLQASLHAVKNPWRNETMHVEGVYTDAEARHILSCTVTLIQLMASDFNQDGVKIENVVTPFSPGPAE